MESVHDVVTKMKGPYNYQDTMKNLDKIAARTYSNLSTKKKKTKTNPDKS